MRSRLAAVRQGFTPLRVMTIGVLIPALWDLALALLASVVVRPVLATRHGENVRGH